MTTTHWVSFEPCNLGRDMVRSACERQIPIAQFAELPTCRDKRCREQAINHRAMLLKHKLKKLREKRG